MHNFSVVCEQSAFSTIVLFETSLSLLQMKRRKALLSEEELLVRDKVNKVSKRASETREQTLHMQARTEPNTYDTYHTACDEGSAIQCCSFYMDYRRPWCFHFHILIFKWQSL